jgi:hypothetical protein
MRDYEGFGRAWVIIFYYILLLFKNMSGLFFRIQILLKFYVTFF